MTLFHKLQIRWWLLPKDIIILKNRITIARLKLKNQWLRIRIRL